MSKNVHIISHSHWDREWYLPFEQHRMRLVELIDKCMEVFEKDDSFKSFFLDGQTIVLDDYLEIRPENKEKLIKYIKEGKFIIGPWYILQDEFYTSGEANIRNLLVGMKEAEKYGAMCKMGYFPDAFGNAGQMPQLLKQAGMDTVTFGRGVRPVGFDNEVQENGNYESPYSEMMWESPDGTKIFGILFANWYNNGNEVPTDKKIAKEYWDDRLKKVATFASTDEYLLMNGCDHQPVQADLGKAIEVASELYPDINFKHSNFPEYIKAIKEKVPNDLAVVKGELTSQDTDGWSTLMNCASSHIYLKQMNRKCELALENGAEPVRVLSSVLGQNYPSDELEYSWKKLMQNHPHDSICCCSVDEVQDEMATRFNKSKQVADYLVSEGKRYIADKINTKEYEKYKNVLPFVVFNTTGRERTSVVSVEIDVTRKSGWLKKCAYDLDEINVPNYKLIDSDGNSIPFKIEDLGVKFGYDLPKDKFRQPYMARRVRVTFEAENISAVGYKTYALVEGDTEKVTDTLVSSENCMENDAIRVEINKNGSLNVTDKASGRTYKGVAYYEETGDLGNEYMYKMPEGSKAITTQDTVAKIELAEDEPYRAMYKITNTITVPKSGDDNFEDEKSHIQQVIDMVKIDNVKSRKIANLSKGYRQRVGLAGALIGDPEILILDEPTVGLDPKQIIEIRNVIKELGKEKTVILSSHILSEISAVCDRVIIINKGKFVAEDTPKNLSDKLGDNKKMLFRISGDREKAENILNSFDGISNVTCVSSENDSYDFEFDNAMAAEEKKKMFFAFAENEIPILMQKEIEPSLEDIFLKLTDNTSEKEENTNESDI